MTSNDQCAIAAIGMAQATLDDIAALRKDTIAPKHADEHTVVGVAAMQRARAAFPDGFSFADWGVVAAPRWPGRLSSYAPLEKYHREGARSVSAMLIPNLCLHAMSGTVSLAFQMHGPNFGVGGGLANVPDGLLAGMVVQLEQNLPGTWVVLTEWNREPFSPAAEEGTPVLQALALALTTEATVSAARHLRLEPSEVLTSQPAYPRLQGLLNYLAAPMDDQLWWCALDWGMDLVLGAEGKV
ncbi:MAG: hypothetical protein L0Y72_03770 [Gemmataceae bacterium]|nr:hypothetical protein [Gemmataceae bacterium]MCI0738137.1 hypothetical protein [Gemmataceae bacterium]